jgi:hypothetical protein
MAALAQATDLPQAQLALEKAHRLVMQIIPYPAPVKFSAAARNDNQTSPPATI